MAVFPELEEGDYYWHDLIGCAVVNTEGYQMGVVSEMMETGSNDVLVVKANGKDAFGKQERLIPFLYEQVVKRVDLTTKTITVEWDAGF
ncbi:16S rRNA processing protein RimM [Pasteurellaceae bacterium RH1A]|nr:16S rRNA processing protein RimM [Pasteurellaceae bacterium RH1A]